MPPEPLAPPWLPPDLAARWESLAADVAGVHPMDVSGWVAEVCRGHETEVDLGSLVLYAGTNLMSPGARAMLAASVGSLPSMGPPGDKYQTGTRWIERLEVAAATLAARAFRARFAEVRLPSGSMANLAVYTALARPGDSLLVVPETAGGHTSHHAQGCPESEVCGSPSCPSTAPR